MKLQLETNFRLQELSEEDQLAIVRLVNHMAAESSEWREACVKKIKEITYS
jgi:hypothetical protein